MSSSLRCSSGKVALISGQILSLGKLVDKMLLQSSPKTATESATWSLLQDLLHKLTPKLATFLQQRFEAGDNRQQRFEAGR